MFKVIDGDFKNSKYSDEEYLDNWPMLYILENGKQAYIGESTHVKTRMTQHTTVEEKRIFKKVHFIYSKLFNQSVTFDYESKLIQYIVADELFQVTNKNSGIADKQYYQKKEYDEKFEILWRKLQKEKLVRHSLEEIENSDLFKYSPYKELNDSQRKAVEEILIKIKDGSVKRVVVNGMPGSGKTIVAVYLMKYLADSEAYVGKQIGFVVPQTSLRKTMKLIFKSIYGLSPAQVLSPSDITKKKYDILIVDEAHRLHQYKNISYMGTFKQNCESLGLTTESDELDWILQQADCVVLFYDSKQVVGPSGIDFQRFDKKMQDSFKRRTIAYFTLLTQMRVLGGNDYIDFVKRMLTGECSYKYHSEKYSLKLYSDFVKFEQDMYDKEAKVGLVRMIAGYAWPWISKKDKNLRDIDIQGVRRKWNHCTEGWVHTAEAIDEVGCIHSIQGYDLNYAFVILGKDIGYDKNTGKVIVCPEYYFDKNGKRTAGYDELLEYITNIYYVLLTRGIRGTYLYVCDEDLREYLSQYLEKE
nr:DNA/RNA helicase domain-containing protein [uncultured Blautia sp.]